MKHPSIVLISSFTIAFAMVGCAPFLDGNWALGSAGSGSRTDAAVDAPNLHDSNTNADTNATADAGTDAAMAEQGPWTLQRGLSILTRPDGESGTGTFGTILSLSGDGRSLAVGDPDYGERRGGGVRIYQRVDTHARFTEISQTVSRPSASYNFGSSVSLSADGLHLAVGDWNWETGTVYLYSRSTATSDFSEAQMLSGPPGSTYFGLVVQFARNERTLVVGDAAYGNASQGALHFYTRSSSQQAFGGSPERFVGPHYDEFSGEEYSFARSVAVSDDAQSIAVGEFALPARDCPSAVHLYERSSPGEHFTNILQTLANYPDARDNFGEALALSTNTLELFVFRPRLEGEPAQVQIYARSERSHPFMRSSETIVGPSDSNPWHFGNGLALRADGHELFVGDSENTIGSGPGRGVIWVFTR